MAQIGNYLFLPKQQKQKIPYGEHARNTIYERQLSPEKADFLVGANKKSV